RRLHAGIVGGNPRQWGWPQIALVAAYDVTGDERYKAAALEFARNGMSLHKPDTTGDFKLGVLADALAYTHAVTRDAAVARSRARYATALSARGPAVDARMMPAVAYIGRVNSADAQRRAAAASVARLKFGNWGKPFTIAARVGFRILSLTSPRAPRHPRPPAARKFFSK